jgi:hypothetical protein
MLLCDTCGAQPRDAEDLAVFVSQLAALGMDARVHVRTIPAGLGRNVQFDLAPFLVDRPLGPEDRMLVIGAHRLTDDKLLTFRRVAEAPVPCDVFGAFATRQAAIGACARLAYVLGAEPRIHDLGSTAAPDGPFGSGISGPVFGVARRSGPAAAAPPRVLLVDPDLAEGPDGARVTAMALSRRFRLSVLTDGRKKGEWQAAHGTEVPMFQYGEVLPADLAARVDVCVCLTGTDGNYRLQCLLANLARSGAVLVDGTPRGDIAAISDAFVRAPRDLGALAAFLETEILPNLRVLGAQAAASRTAAAIAPGSRLPFLDQRPPAPRPTPTAPPVFVATNGIGLGHAQRAALVAREVPGASRPVFAAFPSCMGLVKSHGFDVMPLIGRSALHAQRFENDLANYVRLRALTRTARTLVFDGGYVFDSIYRTILENRLNGVWIRRGLWQATQNNTVALDREKAFARVIVPREAFDELNRAYSRTDRVVDVGPIVRRAALAGDGRARLREALAERYDLGFSQLVVTLLGGGIVADRTTQIQALCGIAERRDDTLHLVVLWPGGRQEAGWFGWRRTRVVRTGQAGALVAAADLCVSASGYNLFHEVLYNRTPAIFVPQMGPFMDDQAARAQAAAERGVAAAVEPPELMRLEREVARFLDHGEGEAARRRMAAVALPEPGNVTAAELIAEVNDGDERLRGDGVTRLSAGGRQP